MVAKSSAETHDEDEPGGPEQPIGMLPRSISFRIPFSNALASGSAFVLSGPSMLCPPELRLTWQGPHFSVKIGQTSASKLGSPEAAGGGVAAGGVAAGGVAAGGVAAGGGFELLLVAA